SFLTYAAGQGWSTPGLELAASCPPGAARRNSRPPIPAPLLRELLTAPGIRPRERALWWLIYEGDARVSEALALNVEDLDLPGRTARSGQRLALWGHATA